MKKLLLMLLVFPCIKASFDEKTCRDVLDEIKAGVPYADFDAARNDAAKIEIAANKIANDPFADKTKRQDARRRAGCAAFFNMAGIYYTSQMELASLDIKFVEQQKNNPALTKKEFLADYLKDKKTDQKSLLDELSFRANERQKSLIASTQDKTIGKEWDKVFQEYMHSDLKDGSQSTGDAEQYL